MSAEDQQSNSDSHSDSDSDSDSVKAFFQKNFSVILWTKASELEVYSMWKR